MRTTFSLSLCLAFLGTASARAADVTFERLVNPEPQNWLTNHFLAKVSRGLTRGTAWRGQQNVCEYREIVAQ
jgi:hypothetical protein